MATLGKLYLGWASLVSNDISGRLPATVTSIIDLVITGMLRESSGRTIQYSVFVTTVVLLVILLWEFSTGCIGSV